MKEAHVQSLKFRAFLSYSHADTRWANWLHRALEGFKIDKDLIGRQTEAGPVPKSLRPVFRDRYDFNASGILKEETVAALNDSAALIVVCSPNSAESVAVNEEIRLFKWHHPDRPTIPVIIRGSPESKSRECFPPALRLAMGDDGTFTDEALDVIAADVRREGDGKHLALAKIVAKLLGLAPDEVFRRAKRERRRRQVAQALVGSALAALLFIGCFFYGQSSNRQRTIADIEDLVNQYTVIASAPGPNPGAKESLFSAIKVIAEGAATDPRYAKALEFLKDGKPANADPLLWAAAEDEAARAKRINSRAAEKFRTVGAIARLGDPKRAREAYLKAQELDPEDFESLYWVGFLNLLAGNMSVAEQSLNRLLAGSAQKNSSRDMYRALLRLGEIEMARGSLSSAIKRQTEALTIAEGAMKTAPNDIERQLDYVLSIEKMGDLLQAQGRFDEAIDRYRMATDINNNLIKAEPGNIEWKRNISISLNKVGEALDALGMLPAARESYMAAFIIRSDLLEMHPGNAALERDVSLSHERIGSISQSRGDFLDALHHYKTSLDIREHIAAADPDNGALKRDISIAQEKIGDVLREQGSLSAALEIYQRCFAIRDHLTRVDAGNAIWQRDLSVALNKMGDIFQAEGKLEAAVRNFKVAFAIREHLAHMDPENAVWQVDLAVSAARLAQIYAARGDTAEARQLLKRGRDVLAPVAERAGNKLWLEHLRSLESDMSSLRSSD